MTVNYQIYTCPVKNAVSVIGDKWTLFIIRELYLGKKEQGFNELQKSLKPISSRTLAKKLKKLLDQRIISKKVISEKPPKVEYKLTKQGIMLEPVLKELARWYKNKDKR